MFFSRPITVGVEDVHYSMTTYEDFRIYKEDVTMVTVNCQMDFADFPFDKHICYFEVRT